MQEKLKKHPMRLPGARPLPTGPIKADESYGVEEFMARVGWRRAALTAARRAGLKIVRTGGRAYVLGRWFHEYLEEQESNEPRPFRRAAVANATEMPPNAIITKPPIDVTPYAA